MTTAKFYFTVCYLVHEPAAAPAFPRDRFIMRQAVLDYSEDVLTQLEAATILTKRDTNRTAASEILVTGIQELTEDKYIKLLRKIQVQNQLEQNMFAAQLQAMLALRQPVDIKK
jgi:hypothetical protein